MAEDQSLDLESEKGREQVRQIAREELTRLMAEEREAVGARPGGAPRFGTTGFLDPALEYFVRSELEKQEARLKEHLERELRKFADSVDERFSKMDARMSQMSDSFGDRINKALMWAIGAAFVLTGLALTLARYWLFPGAGG